MRLRHATSSATSTRCKGFLDSGEQAEETKMSTVTIGVASPGDTQRRATAAFRGKKQGARISFASEDLLWKTLTPIRWALLKLMAGQGSMAIREIARWAERDVRAVHRDIHVLLRAGVLEKATESGVVFPYDAIHVDFLLNAA
jgi:predicted transcriptional regulator